MAFSTSHVVFVHGLWVTAASWDNFRAPFEAAGYTTHAPEWSFFQGKTAAELRADPPKELNTVTLGKIADEMQAFIETLPEPPLIVGHSFGGLWTQLLLDRGLGAAGAAIDPAPIGGVFADPVSLGGAFPVIARWNGWGRPYLLSPQRFHDRFGNTASRAFTDAFYEQYVVPTAGRFLYQAAFWLGNFVNTAKRAQPLLITGADKDRLVAPPMARWIYNAQKRAPARTDFHLFANRSHLLCAEPGWEQVAGAVIDWASTL